VRPEGAALMGTAAGLWFGRQSEYPVRLHQGAPMRAYVDVADVRDSRGRSMWRVYRLVETTKEYVGPAALPWREAVRLAHRLNREAGLEGTS
jgi:hypothetical protein